MKRSFILVSFLLVLSLGLVVACDTNTTQFVSPGEAVFDLADFAETLFANGRSLDKMFWSSSSSAPAPLRRWPLPSPTTEPRSPEGSSIGLPHHISSEKAESSFSIWEMTRRYSPF
jgi:hypothetical protein